MSDETKNHDRDTATFVEWPAEVLEDPDYPVLEETVIDLASDAIVFKAPFNPNDF
ncbi:MAG: hypothetical protein AAFN79_19690 [Pseudomonadota bacterium]